MKDVKIVGTVPSPSIKPFGGGANKSSSVGITSGAKPQGSKSSSQPNSGASGKVVTPTSKK